MTIVMNAGNGLTGVLQLPAPSGRLVALYGGYGWVYADDVALAIQQGWTVGGWERGMYLTMFIPGATSATQLNFPSGQVTLPNGQQVQYVNGLVGMPVPQVNAALGQGFTVVPGPQQSR